MEVFRDKEGKICSDAQRRIIERREVVAYLYREMLPEYSNKMKLYDDMTQKVTEATGKRYHRYTVINDLRELGIIGHPKKKRRRRARKSRIEN